MITGVDLVQAQLLLALEDKYDFKQEDLKINGHAMQCRINAEDPETFVPSPGRIERVHRPGGYHVRFESQIYSGYKVPANYDSLIAEVIVKDKDRDRVINKMRVALQELVVEGIKTNQNLHQRILEDKGVLCLVEAYKIAKAKNANLSLYIAGSLDEENPSSISKEHFDQIINFKDINYLGKIKNIKKYWQEANIAVLLSKREGLPLSLLEAAAIGRPIISTDVTGSREIAINNYNAININVGDALECSKAIIKLSKNKILRKKYGKNSRKLVESDMALDHICSQYYSLYREIIC